MIKNRNCSFHLYTLVASFNLRSDAAAVSSIHQALPSQVLTAVITDIVSLTDVLCHMSCARVVSGRGE